ncbi:uncharacterized protein LOC106080872 [Stomoxys calcitrans]|uniref:Uncharacterized protein n=1 Tax=Stomoxys calcitrans TaxID=35570 RepID=A0A1I8NR85_STOCA|nr:uncharacterized protein LOC106080872 [Stomoxys calcitrans]
MDNNNQILVDTEPETSLEHDGEEGILAITRNATKSLYNITFENFDQHESVEFKNYESRLQKEIKDWKSLFQTAYNDLKKSEQKHPIIDKSILPQEKREYLEKAPCLQSFIRESLAFRRQAYEFLEIEYAEAMELAAYLEEECEHRLLQVKTEILTENLASYSRRSSSG